MFAASKTAAAAAGTPPPSTDPQFNYVTMLLHGDGTNGAQNNTFVDSSTNNFTITRNGTPTQGSFSPYGDLWSNYFNGTSDFLTVPTSTAFDQSGDFTIESWIYLTAAPASGTTIGGAIYSQESPSTRLLKLSVYNNLKVAVTQAGVGQVFTSTQTLSLFTWYHVALVKNGSSTGNIKLYINGVNDGSGTKTDPGASTTTSYIGREAYTGTGTIYFPGYMSNWRFVKGTALYTSNFTPSTTPLTAVSGTSLLTCQSNRFRDASSNNFAITVTGTPSVQRFSPFDPATEYSTSVIGGSGQFPGATTSFLSIPQNTAFDFGTGDFTVEAWVYPTATTQQAVVGKWTGTGQVAWILQLNPGSSNIQFAYGNSGNFAANVTFSGTLRANNWSHIAVTRSGTSVRAFINGVQAGATQTISATMTATNANLVVGKVESDNNNAFNGYISNLRLVIGTAVYTANFTPPTAPLTAITNTSLLLNCVNAGIYDNAMMNNLVTVGNAQVSTAVKKYGTGSMYFDGTGDWLTFVDSPNVQLGTGDFTIEGWVNLSLLGAARGIFSKGTSTTGLSLAVNALNQVVFNYTASSLTGTTVLMANTWYHIAVVRSGSATGNVKIYINGTADATSGGAITDNFNQTNAGYIGADRIGTSPMNGYIDDLRITKGYARYTANFTPPTAAFPNN